MRLVVYPALLLIVAALFALVIKAERRRLGFYVAAVATILLVGAAMFWLDFELRCSDLAQSGSVGGELTERCPEGPPWWPRGM